MRQKKLTFEKTSVYKQYKERCKEFIKIINSLNKNQELSEKSSLENFLIDGSVEVGKKYIEIYKEYKNIQNNLLKKLTEKINSVSYEPLESQEINIQEAQRDDLLSLEFDNKSEFLEIFLMNTSREIYNNNSKIKYNNYNLFFVDFDKIEKSFEEILIRKACFLRTDEIIEMKYSNEEFLNDGLHDLSKNIVSEKLTEKDKMESLIVFEKNLKTNLTSCLETNEGLKNITSYINGNITTIDLSQSLYDVINSGGFPYSNTINDILREFLKNNTDIKINKLNELIIFFQNLYFELAMENSNDFKVVMDEETKERINNYYNQSSGQWLTKEKISETIMKFLLIVKIHEKNGKNGLVEMDDNLFDYLNNIYLWKNDVYTNVLFTKECVEYKNLGILVKNAYDFYKLISFERISKLEKENKEILDKIRIAENEKIKKEKNEKIEEEKKKIDNEEDNEVENLGGDIDDEDLGDLDEY